MSAPFVPNRRRTIAISAYRQPDSVAVERFVREAGGSVFQRPTWLAAIERGTGQKSCGLLARDGASIVGWLPLSEIASPLFGRALVSSGFGVGGGILARDPGVARRLADASIELAGRRSCTGIELRGGITPDGWEPIENKHAGFVAPLAADDAAQLAAIPRKQRAEIRKGLKNGLDVTIGLAEHDRAAHYGVYAASVHNLGTPVFPRSLFDGVLDAFGADADILTIWHRGNAVASVLTLYHAGAAMPYWGGGTWAARDLRANEVMYYALMNHARERGCERFDFGRSKTGSGAYTFKKNWGFEPEPLTYSKWTAPGTKVRNIDPTDAGFGWKIALWKRLPAAVAMRLGPAIARGLG